MMMSIGKERKGKERKGAKATPLEVSIAYPSSEPGVFSKLTALRHEPNRQATGIQGFFRKTWRV